MSENNKTQEPDATHEQLLIETVAIPAFAEKLAANGVQWRNDQEFAMMYEMGSRLYQDHMVQQTKQAGDINPFLQDLYAKTCGQQAASRPDINDAHLQKCALEGVQSDPSLKQAALAYLEQLSEAV